MTLTVLIWLALTGQGYEIISVDPAITTIAIRLDDQLTNGSDGACEIAMQTFHSLTRWGFVVYVMNPENDGFVPSRMNPMTQTWTAHVLNDKSKY